MHTRYAIVGTGSRAEMFTRALTGPHRDTCALVALADPEPHRLAVHNARLPAPVPTYPATEFRRMLHEEKVDVAIVTTVDRVHDEYIVAALEAGCDVLTEKPMTVDAQRCARILDAVRRTGRRVRVTFNYRYNPFHETFKRLIADGEIGEVGSVHFEWLLDVRHGADYFRRWHRAKANSGGLLVHKSGHHFDLVNWWLDDDPAEVYAQGRLFFYGSQEPAPPRRRSGSRWAGTRTATCCTPAPPTDTGATRTSSRPGSPSRTTSPSSSATPAAPR
ncbi:Gfo/Idh/MocA family protein [Dactylosporangium cerinum]